MAAELIADDDDYVDIEIASFSNFLPSHPNPAQEFEFQISICQESQPSSSSPAGQLFYKGKLLPLHHLQNSNSLYHHESDHNAFQEFNNESESESQSEPKLAENEEFYSTPPTITPFESCNVSPSESCRFSRELNPYPYEYNFGSVDIDEKDEKKTRKQLKQFSNVVGSKLRAWFGKASCKYEASCAAKVADEVSVSKAGESFNNKQHQHVKVANRIPFGQIQGPRIHKEKKTSDKFRDTCFDTDIRYDMKYRRCFTASENEGTSPEISKSSKSSLFGSSSFSLLPNKSYGYQEHQLLGCGGANFELGNSILGAIAHCKQSQQHIG